jgi:hypothetical protein
MLVYMVLIHHSEKRQNCHPAEARVVRAISGTRAMKSTTGEVNLYFDLTTFGSEVPRFYTD